MISNRLKSLVKYISSEDKVIDIGCDHALLDIYLVKEKVINNIIVSDIHESALKAGIDNIVKNKLTKKIDARLGNGLSVLSGKDDVDTVLISGMGTKTILDILNNGYLSRINKLVIQSNNNHEELRREIIKLGFYIIAEEYFVDNGKNYINIIFKRGYKKYSKDEIKYGPILIHDKDYLDFEIKTCEKIKNFIKDGKLKYRLALNLEIRKLNKLLKK